MYSRPFPLVVGTKDALKVSFEGSGNASDFIQSFEGLVPGGLRHVPGKKDQIFLQNGSMIKVGPAKGGRCIETATPECVDPYQIATYSQANEVLVTDMLSEYVRRIPDSDTQVRVGVQRKAVGTEEYNGIGSNDNFAIHYDTDGTSQFKSIRYRALLNLFLASHAFMTGAGHIGKSGYRFAQKADAVDCRTDGDFARTGYVYAQDDVNGDRLRVQCNDINISPWAKQIRLGGVALFVALLETPLAAKIMGDISPSLRLEDQVRGYSEYNALSTDSDGNLLSSHGIREALDVQLRVLDAMMRHLGKYIELREVDIDIIEQSLQYAEDFQKVLRGHESWGLLSDRSDLAAKFDYIAQRMQEDRNSGVSRKPGDARSLAADLDYGNTVVRRGDSGEVEVTKGIGVVLRDAGQFKMAIKPQDIEVAYQSAPRKTRAYDRGGAILLGQAEVADWGMIIDKSGRLIPLGEPLLNPNNTLLKKR